jgi:hypothetical protein
MQYPIMRSLTIDGAAYKVLIDKVNENEEGKGILMAQTTVAGCLVRHVDAYAYALVGSFDDKVDDLCKGLCKGIFKGYPDIASITYKDYTLTREVDLGQPSGELGGRSRNYTRVIKLYLAGLSGVKGMWREGVRIFVTDTGSRLVLFASVTVFGTTYRVVDYYAYDANDANIRLSIQEVVLALAQKVKKKNKQISQLKYGKKWLVKAEEGAAPVDAEELRAVKPAPEPIKEAVNFDGFLRAANSEKQLKFYGYLKDEGGL